MSESIRMVTPKFALGVPQNDWRPVLLCDSAGNLLHTEPVCEFPEDWFPWFGEWILAQECPIQLPAVATTPPED